MLFLKYSPVVAAQWGAGFKLAIIYNKSPKVITNLFSDFVQQSSMSQAKQTALIKNAQIRNWWFSNRKCRKETCLGL